MPSLVIEIGDPYSGWALGTPYSGWQLGDPWGGAVSGNSVSYSQLSCQNLYVPVSATVAGASYNPTSDTVQMAFMPQATQVPQNADWKTSTWTTSAVNVLYPYSATCLIGPGGTVTLGVGTYVIYVKVAASPEVVVDQAPMQLEIY